MVRIAKDKEGDIKSDKKSKVLFFERAFWT